MDDRLRALHLFARVARLGSFSAAAREERIAQPTASRIVARLERELGAALLVRNSRAVTLTDAGAAYLAAVEPALAALEEAAHRVRGQDTLGGTLRFALTSSLAVRVVIPAIATFAAWHPALRLVLIVSDERRDLVEDGVDVALRLGPLADSAMVARPVGRWPIALFAAPAYLASAGMPEAPGDLRRLAAIYHSESATQLWTFRQGEREERLEIAPAHVVSSQEGCIAAARAGLGFIYSATIAVRREIADGDLIRLLPGWEAGTIEANLLFPAGRAAGPAARALADFLTGLDLWS